MKNKRMYLTLLVAVGLLAACTGGGLNGAPSGAQVFPTPTNNFLFEGNVPASGSDSPVSLSGAPTVASVFRTPPSATPSPIATATLPPEPTEAPLPAPQVYTVTVYGENLNPNWVLQKQTGMNFNLQPASQVNQNHASISATPRGKGDAALIFTVSNKAGEMYPRDQVTKLSFGLYSPKTPIYLDQFSVSILGSNSQAYWSAKDQSVKASDYGSIFPEIHLDELGFNQAIPANTWVTVEVDLDKVLTLEPKYQYITGISLNSTAGPTHTLLIDNLQLTLLGQPPTPVGFVASPTPTATPLK